MSMTDATSPTSSADRSRRYRERISEGLHVARVEVGPEDIEALVSEGLLGLGKSANRREISKAIERLLLALSENAIDIVPEWFEYQNDEEEAVSA